MKFIRLKYIGGLLFVFALGWQTQKGRAIHCKSALAQTQRTSGFPFLSLAGGLN
jgi:hypothetical protein